MLHGITTQRTLTRINVKTLFRNLLVDQRIVGRIILKWVLEYAMLM